MLRISLMSRPSAQCRHISLSETGVGIDLPDNGSIEDLKIRFPYGDYMTGYIEGSGGYHDPRKTFRPVAATRYEKGLRMIIASVDKQIEQSIGLKAPVFYFSPHGFCVWEEFIMYRGPE